MKEASVSRCLVHVEPRKKEFHSIAVNGASARNWRHSRAALHEERMKLLDSFASFSLPLLSSCLATSSMLTGYLTYTVARTQNMSVATFSSPSGSQIHFLLSMLVSFAFCSFENAFDKFFAIFIPETVFETRVKGEVNGLCLGFSLYLSLFK